MGGEWRQSTIDQIKAKTGFPVSIPDQRSETKPPSTEELNLLRQVIDPLGIRRLELLGGSERRSLLRHIIQSEAFDLRQVGGVPS